jgi:arsenite-transporting ATPase
MARTGRRVLAVSTDPAHSLGDALNIRLTSRVRAIPIARGQLKAVELDGKRAFGRWLRDHRRGLVEVLEHGTWLDRQDIDSLLQLAIPGVDELMALLEVVRLSSHDAVVVDTAPTGHTLRLLASPAAVQAVVRVFEALQEDHRVVRAQLARVSRPDAADRLISELDEQARLAGALLRDPSRCQIHWVMLPEALAIEETLDAERALGASGISITEFILNRVTPPGPSCPVCDRRRRGERVAIAAVQRRWRGRPVRFVDALVDEPRGLARLRPIGERLLQPPAPIGQRSIAAAGRSRSNRSSDAPLKIASLAGARLLFCGGKGGVGKTTVAAAIALRLARAQPRKSILLLSTDPAHSLGDVLAMPVNDAPSSVRSLANLLVRELDPRAALAARRAPLEASLRAVADEVGSQGLGTIAGRSIRELIDLAPPGIDELLGVLSILDARNAYHTIVVDTAPTGHALRLLETPAAAREWVQALIRLLLKYRALVRPAELAGDLVTLSREIRALQALLADGVSTRFIAVTRAAELPMLETRRLLTELKRLHLATPFVVVNALTPAAGTCNRCRAGRAAEARALAPLVETCRRIDCAIIQAPLDVPPPRGPAALSRWGRAWIE